MQYALRLVDRLHSGMHHDFCPWANNYVYWLKRPIGCLILGLVASSLLGMTVSPKALFGTAAISALVAIGALWPMIAMCGIRGKIGWDSHRCEEGHDVGIELKIVNRWAWPVWGLVVETDHQVASRPEAPGVPIALSRVAPMATSEFSWVCRPTSRGVFPTEKVRLTTSFPFGLWSFGRDIEVAKPMIVWPSTTKLTDLPEQRGKAFSAVGAMSPMSGHEGDWFGVRPYREGDSLRQIHWAQSARRDSLIVCERQQCTRQHGVLWLDDFANESCDDGEQSEFLIRMFASLAKHFASHSWSLQVWLGGSPNWLHPGQSQLQAFLDRLAAYRWSGQTESSALSKGPMGSANRFDSDAMRLPGSPDGGWFLGVTTVSRYASLNKESVDPKGDRQWALLQTKSVLPTDDRTPIHCNSDRLLIVEDGEGFSTQLRSEWQQFTQRAQKKLGVA